MSTTKSSDNLGAQVAFFPSLARPGRNVPLQEILAKIKNGQWSEPVNRLRNTLKDSADYDSRKKRLPAFMVSATTKGGSKNEDLEDHNGLLQIDIDQLGAPAAIALRDRIGRDPHIMAAWLSPGGEGVKAIMCIPADMNDHKTAFAAAAFYISTIYKVEMDSSCSNVNRLCFVSYDCDLVLNPSPVSFVVPSREGSNPQRGEDWGGASSTSLHTESASASAFYITRPFFKDWPALIPVFKRQVTRRFEKPQRGQRNSVIVEIAAALYCVLRPDFVTDFVLEYCHLYADVFCDYPEGLIRREAASVVEGCRQSYPAKLPDAAQQAYQRLENEQERAAFRICRSLSLFESGSALPRGDFFLSCNQLGLRLGIMDTPAHRILRKLEANGIIKTLSKGILREKNRPSKATTYRWLLADAEEDPGQKESSEAA